MVLVELKNQLKILLLAIQEIRQWVQREFAAPSPNFIKRKVLLREAFKKAVWVETGTYKGDTTNLLARNNTVYSIEPSKKYYLRAKKRFRKNNNVFLFLGTSEEMLEVVLALIPQGSQINFWLDGHYSGAETFKGVFNSPILKELQIIMDNVSKFRSVCIFIDDIRCFGSMTEEYQDYPNLNFLVDWCNQFKLSWHIEHDILIAKTVVN
jgi:hypothetical protein